VIDLIAGLTEQSALDMHRRLSGISPGSITDMLLR
jgi:dGTP triphosphohydrolase